MMKRSFSEKGNNYTDLLVGNRSLVVKLLMKSGGCSRSELARMSGLSQAAITKITGNLIELGIIEETSLGRGEKGRRTINLKLCADRNSVLGVKIGRKDYAVGAFDLDGRMICKETCPVSCQQEPQAVLSSITATVEKFCQSYQNIIAVGVSVPGPYLRGRGIIAKMTTFPGWREINLIHYLGEHIQVPVFVEHDANAGALAEWWFGNVQSEVLVHIIASEGIGAGIINHGQLLCGAVGTAGEIGHMSIAFDGRPCECGPASRGCLEQYCSALAFMRDIREHIGKYPHSLLWEKPEFSIEDVFAAAGQGDEFCCEMIHQLGAYFGIGITNVINIYNPDTIIISDIMSGAGEPLLESIRETVRGRVVPETAENTVIRFSEMKEDASLYGAAAIAVDRFLENPMGFTMK